MAVAPLPARGGALACRAGRLACFATEGEQLHRFNRSAAPGWRWCSAARLPAWRLRQAVFFDQPLGLVLRLLGIEQQALPAGRTGAPGRRLGARSRRGGRPAAAGCSGWCAGAAPRRAPVSSSKRYMPVVRSILRRGPCGHVLAARDDDVVAQQHGVGLDVEDGPVAGGGLAVLGGDQHLLRGLDARQLRRRLGGRVVRAAGEAEAGLARVERGHLHGADDEVALLRLDVAAEHGLLGRRRSTSSVSASMSIGALGSVLKEPSTPPAASAAVSAVATSASAAAAALRARSDRSVAAMRPAGWPPSAGDSRRLLPVLRSTNRRRPCSTLLLLVDEHVAGEQRRIGLGVEVGLVAGHAAVGADGDHRAARWRPGATGASSSCARLRPAPRPQLVAPPCPRRRCAARAP